MHKIDIIDDGTFNITNEYVPHINLTYISHEYIYQIDHIYDLLYLNNYKDTISGLSNTRTIDRYWRIKRLNSNWSDWSNLNIGDFIEFPDVTSKDEHSLQIKWIRTGTNDIGHISIENFEINAEWDRNTLSEPIVNITELRKPIFLRPSDIYKVFNIDGFELISTGITDTRTLTIHYRISQDTGKTWTQWEELTNENISTVKFTPIRFFIIEYKFERGGTNIEGSISINELNLIGDFQNVSQDYKKINLLGVRECCNENSLDHDAEIPEFLTQTLTDEEKEKLFNPYALNGAINFYNKVSNDTNEVFGHEVTYFVTNPDSGGIDNTFHEYQLYSVDCSQDIKVSVDNNQFPDNQIVFNQFDLSLFETFEIHITKDSFKEAFGVDKRPSKEDFLWFCNLNRMYQVEHAQPYRDFNNSAVFYKVILRKYNKKSSVQAGNDTISDRISQLIKNTTIDELMGIESKNDKKDVAFKDQHATLSKDPIRKNIDKVVIIEKELIDNASLVISKYHYNFSKLSNGDTAITYKNNDPYVKVSDNRAFSFWFKFDSKNIGYISNENYYFLNNYDENSEIGYKIYHNNGDIRFQINKETYSLPVELDDNIWYCYVVNLDQRRRKINQFLYKRNIDDESKSSKLISSKLKLLEVNNLDLNIQEFEFEPGSDILMGIKASQMRLTNIRIYNDIIPANTHDKLLNQNIIRDTSYVILADNANKQLKLDNYPYGTEN